MPLRSIRDEKKLAGKRVLVRVDFNVPLKKGKVLDLTRLEASVPTIDFLHKQDAVTILVTHVGRPNGRRTTTLSTKPLAKALGNLLGRTVVFIPGVVGPRVTKAIAKLKPGSVALLENVRFEKDEEKNTGTLAFALSALADLFVLDGFAVAHRASASVSGVPQHLPSYAGLLLETEIEGLEKVVTRPKKPYVVVLGGAKIETKLPIVKQLLPKATTLLPGGGLVNTYLAARGYDVGASLVGKEFFAEARKYLGDKKVIHPLDVVVGDATGYRYRVVSIKRDPHTICKRGEAIFDIGPATIRLYASHIKKAKTLLWNGAMGYFEQKPYNVGTLSVARLIASRAKGTAFGVVGGGETLQAVALVHGEKDIDLVSTGGGAMLEFLAGADLPGIVALDSPKRKTTRVGGKK